MLRLYKLITFFSVDSGGTIRNDVLKTEFKPRSVNDQMTFCSTSVHASVLHKMVSVHKQFRPASQQTYGIYYHFSCLLNNTSGTVPLYLKLVPKVVLKQTRKLHHDKSLEFTIPPSYSNAEDTVTIYGSDLLILLAYAPSMSPLLSLPLSMACDDSDGYSSQHHVGWADFNFDVHFIEIDCESHESVIAAMLGVWHCTEYVNLSLICYGRILRFNKSYHTFNNTNWTDKKSRSWKMRKNYEVTEKYFHVLLKETYSRGIHAFSVAALVYSSRIFFSSLETVAKHRYHVGQIYYLRLSG
ncbi:hypothetical protein Tco_1111301 [Tanacetum coccineum]|uniref:Uncharacterized protein n=1 Tax=Tanacetum coccineum TaxID=301880 RepID=A0ABQ5IND6_9ASTR